ncbi:MAG: UrcA family protein [Proteobacteria bacterium]|nr:UrcA family protein [Pseudomonadota bacterium]
MAFRPLFSSVLVALGLLSAAPGHAGAIGPLVEQGDTVSVKVRVGDLDLNSREGARAALGRIHVAAQLICGPTPSPVQIERLSIYNACMKSDVDQAVASLDRPLLTALNTTHGQAYLRVARR